MSGCLSRYSVVRYDDDYDVCRVRGYSTVPAA